MIKAPLMNPKRPVASFCIIRFSARIFEPKHTKFECNFTLSNKGITESISALFRNKKVYGHRF